MMSYAQLVRQWFGREKRGGLVLPDGWYGRPYDNLHTLVSINEETGALAIDLDVGLMLHFTGLRSLQPRGRDLVFSKFDRLHFKWRGIGSPGGTKDYSGGEVTLVSQSLTR
jgi:hypothetical protein